jgi:hypothetical protein
VPVVLYYDGGVMYIWGEYILTIRDADNNLIEEIKYTGMSGNAMMNEVFCLRVKYPVSAGFIIDW